jgi:DNA-binding NarL/FixJ family response regulator
MLALRSSGAAYLLPSWCLVQPAAGREVVIDRPIRPLTPTQLKVARLVSMGYDYARIGELLNIEAKTASVYVCAIADLLPNPEGLKPYTLVLLWSAHQRWLEEREAVA